ncbi:MAG: CHASE2 domain-containing protein [Symploca sp. SIO3E6]|nr:CHASE2 domain-containing protein [Caldora sp. SIO3E6]
MGKLVVLKLDGEFDEGFQVTLEIGSKDSRPETEITGRLPPAPELVENYRDWLSTYHSLGIASRELKVKEVRVNGSLQTRKEECRNSALGLCSRLNRWLSSESFRPIREKWLEKLDTSEEVWLIIRTKSRQLQKLPWHLWDLLERYPQAEIALSAPECELPTRAKIPTAQNQVRILAILGNSAGINVKKDRQLLENLPGAATTFLVEPLRRELNDQLWEQPWDILFFAGHSKTEGDKGRIYLNQTDSLTIDEVRFALRTAVAGGLQIAIFNSCDGLGLVREFESLHIPQMIVMREQVPDQVAQAFLTYFLLEFARGTPFYPAERQARERLQGLEDKFPCASWLPVICQNPAVKPQTWQELRDGSEQEQQSQLRWRRLCTTLIVSVAITSLVVVVRELGMLQRWELQAYDQLMRLRPDEGLDSRLLVVEATEEDVNRYGFPLADAILAQVLEKLELHQPRVIGLDIFREQPREPGHAILVSRLQQNDRLIALCSVSEADNPNKPGTFSKSLGALAESQETNQ